MRDAGHWERERIRGLPVSEPPPPWRGIATVEIPGLFEVGFGEGEHAELLLAISPAGRTVIDCRSGEVVAHDQEGEGGVEWYDPMRLRAEGTGPLSGKTIRLAGLHGGGLQRVSEDRFALVVAYPDWPDAAVLLQLPPDFSSGRHPTQVKIACCEDPRACGFSETGKTFVIAEPHAVQIFGR